MGGFLFYSFVRWMSKKCCAQQQYNEERIERKVVVVSDIAKNSSTEKNLWYMDITNGINLFKRS